VRSAINQRQKLESQGQGVVLLGTPRMQHLWRYITDPRSICDVLLFPLLRPNATEPHRYASLRVTLRFLAEVTIRFRPDCLALVQIPIG
jgi:hypothetical protein